jgi:hypothetical protein
MSRIGKIFIVMMAVGGMSLAYLVDGQQPPAKAPKAPQAPQGGQKVQTGPASAATAPTGPASDAQAPGAPAMADATFSSVPGYYLLGMDQVQDQLKLDDKQKEQIKKLNQTYTEESQQELQTLREMAPQEQQKKLPEAQRRAMKRVDTLRQSLEGVLTDPQRKELRQLSFQMAVPQALNNPQLLDRLQITDKQKQQLQAVRDKTQQKLWGLEQEMAKDTLDVLTPDQQKILHGMDKQD